MPHEKLQIKIVISMHYMQLFVHVFAPNYMLTFNRIGRFFLYSFHLISEILELSKRVHRKEKMKNFMNNAFHAKLLKTDQNKFEYFTQFLQ